MPSEMEKQVAEKLSRTIGHAESLNQREFMKGAMMAVREMERIISEEVKWRDIRIEVLEQEENEFRELVTKLVSYANLNE